MTKIQIYDELAICSKFKYICKTCILQKKMEKMIEFPVRKKCLQEDSACLGKVEITKELAFK